MPAAIEFFTDRHGPNIFKTVLRRQAYQFELRPSGQQLCNLRQKSGLNRAILDGSPFELRRQRQNKTDWRGGLFYAVPAQNTSRTRPVAWGGCGQVSADNCKTQAKLVCLKCGLSANADSISAVNIREAGLASLACSQLWHAVSASWQEPTEGIHSLGVEPVGIPGLSPGRTSKLASVHTHV